MDPGTPHQSTYLNPCWTALSALTIVTQIVTAGVMPAVAQEPHDSGDPGRATEAPPLVYVSDYFSFVGGDDKGLVAFALDTNRGRDGDEYQAEHFVVLHDEQAGWTEVAGNGDYENQEGKLLAIPNSSFFQYQGSPATGMKILSPENKLTLRVEPIVERHSNMQGESKFIIGSAPAVMEWAGRTLKGRIIYEYLYMPDFNRLSRTYFGLWKEFQGFYVSVEGKGDLYVHNQRSKKLTPLIGGLVGFTVLDGQADKMDDLAITVLKRALALGFYRWPKEWELKWVGTHGTASVKFKLSDRKVLKNWVIGGFAMGVIRGEIAYNGRTWPFYGLAELLM
ncbi:MAG: hypothetical protein ACE5NA_06165 [Nitrospiraceae bacterium]